MSGAADLERGLPIVKATACRVGMHVHVWINTGGGATRAPAPGTPCSCGLRTWTPDGGVETPDVAL